jgi:hypothetical protein
VLVADLGAVLQHVEEGHGVSAAHAVVLLEPGRYLSGLALLPETTFVGQVEKGGRDHAGLGLDRVDIGLEGHVALLGG